MAIDITNETITATRTTGPLSAFSQFMMTISFLGSEGPEAFLVPGVILQGESPEFVDGYAWGRSCYFTDVDEALNATDGTSRHGCFTIEELRSGAVRIEKVRDITATHLMQYIRDVLEEDEDVEMSEATRFGMIMGYIAACVECFHGLTCPECGRTPGLCNHR